jgi:hypothetical protein
VRKPASPLLWLPRPSSRGRTPDAPRRHAAAGHAGHRAKLGRVFLQVPPPSPTRARRLPSLAPLAVGSHPVLAAAVARCRSIRVRVRARVRASRNALAQACTPERACRSPRGEAGPLAPSLAPDLQFALLSAAPPWPRRGGLPRARGHRGGSAALLTGECTLRHRPSFPRAEPSCDRLVCRHPWRRPKLRHAACFQSVSGLSPCRSPLRARAHQRSSSHARCRPPDQQGVPAPTPTPRRRRRARAGVGLTATSTSPRPSALRAQQPKGILVDTPC